VKHLKKEKKSLDIQALKTNAITCKYSKDFFVS